jgi:3-oxoacyl-[acyl-carrier protein] reductase
MAARVVLITGGSRGLGAGLVTAFLEHGDSVATCSRSPPSHLGDAGAPDWSERFYWASVNLAEADECKRFVAGVVERFGRIDVLVNNAGVARERVLPMMPDQEVDELVDLNLKATIRMTRLVSRRMLRQGSGRIINISSIGGQSGYRGLAVYSATKAAVDGLTRALARELGSRGITVNSVAPGYVRTELSRGLDTAQLAQITRRTPAGRLGEVRDVAAAVRFLASAEAAFITGHVLVVDGGLTA